MVEVIIVVGIMAILVGLVAPNFIQYLDKARKARDMEMARVLGTGLERAIAIDSNASANWTKITNNSVMYGSHVEYKVIDHTTGKQYTITNVFEFTLTKAGDIAPNAKWPGCENNFRNGVLRNARSRKIPPRGEDPLWDNFTEEISSVTINIMYRKYNIRQYKIMKNLDNGRVEVWVSPVPPGTDGEGNTNGWVYYRLYPDPDPRYMSNEPPVGTNTIKGGQAPTTF